MTTHPPQAALTIEQLVGRMQEEVAREFDLPIAETRCAGVLASVLTPLDESGTAESAFNYTNPHCDKANRVAYDYSSILYLNSSEVDFGGGAFVFLDDEKQPLSDFDDSESPGGDVSRHVVLPRMGRLVMFSSGVENVHHVEPVTALQPEPASAEGALPKPAPTEDRGWGFGWAWRGLMGSGGLGADPPGEHRRVTLSSWWTHSEGSEGVVPIALN